MTLPVLKAVLATGDQYGSGLRDMMAWLATENILKFGIKYMNVKAKGGDNSV